MKFTHSALKNDVLVTEGQPGGRRSTQSARGLNGLFTIEGVAVV